ncbi:hypothetical protein [Eleftheria terrae]|uniref:hypothetical protein n=1 Tax=Eleftheria terrae TaxID=1597781 RepID=UPI00263B4E66|nr:hypothetical protein [Eleftheria terrae]WKB52227.1 hypothetical protein N7L95_20905 [Eleftheria terrae]
MTTTLRTLLLAAGLATAATVSMAAPAASKAPADAASATPTTNADTASTPASGKHVKKHSGKTHNKKGHAPAEAAKAASGS